jgi:hypothetical protein
VTDLSYDDWTELLHWHFFRIEHAGKPLFLFVDDDVIAEVAQEPDAASAVNRFVAMLRRHIGDEGTGTLFRDITVRSIRWFDEDASGPMPGLPLLAAEVLAASRMAADRQVGGNNYYLRFRDLLHLHGGQGRPPGFDWATESIWQRLDHWLDVTMAGALGRSTIPEHPSLRYVGLPISQALWRTADRWRLYEFLAATGRRVGNVGDAESLVADFRRWASVEGGFSVGVRLMLERKEMRDQLDQIITAVATAWDGALPGREDAVPISVLLRANRLGRVHPELVAPQDPGQPVTIAAHASSGESIELTAVGGWYDVVVSNLPEALTSGIVLEADTVRFKLAARSVHVFVEQPRLGGWLSGSPALSATPLRLLVRDPVTSAINAYLAGAAADGWSSRGLQDIAGWTLFEGVELQATRAAPADPRLAPLLPPPRDVFRLSGGLSLGPGSRYLIGGEPDVVMAPGIHAASMAVVVDGDVLGDISGDRPVRLRGRDLTAGVHRVVVGASELAFTTSPGDGRSRRPEADIVLRIGALHVVGATLLAGAPTVAPPVVLNARVRQVLLGARPADSLVVSPFARPGWMSHVGLEPGWREVWTTFTPAWVLKRDSLGKSISPLSTEEPEPPAADEPRVVTDWARWILRYEHSRVAPESEARWARYVRVARDLTGS